MQKTKDPNILRGLQYFEAVARHRSLRRAAQDLGVTESAVSHQMRRFSDTIGQQLLIRSGRGIALTATGERLAAKLVEAFAGLESLVSDLAGSGEHVLQLAVCSSFGPGWLIGRLDDFYEAHPQIDLQLRLYAQDPLLTNEVADAFVTAYPVRPEHASLKLKDEHLVAVHAPLPGRREDQRFALITTDIEKGRVGQDWITFCKRADLKLGDIQQGLWRQCSHYLLALEMAKNGQGIALVPDFLAEHDLCAGSLVAFSDVRLPSHRTYHLCFRKSRAHEPQLQALARWFRSRVAEDRPQPMTANATAARRSITLERPS
ncbi:LysR family transcriptional regulator [Aestuariivirga sp.]|uniref:LysR family transcriptional regulator n=1 Tax=Aestuariivirga sp. TaxID=2650926 RepID=UPI003593FD28